MGRGPSGRAGSRESERLLQASFAVALVVLVALSTPSLAVPSGGPAVAASASGASFGVSFSETGLAPGSLWEVSLAGVARNSTASTITFIEPNGTYGFTVGAVSGYGTSPPSGSTTVDGAAETVPIGFVSVPVRSVPVGARPFSVAADAAAQEVVSANAGSNNVSVVDAATGGLVSTVAVGSSPSSVTVDAAADAAFVTNSGSGTVSVLNLSTDRIVATLPVGSHPIAAVVDPATGLVYVANELSANVSVLNATADRVVGAIPVGSEPVALVATGPSDAVYVADAGSGSVSIINGTSRTVAATVPVGDEPFAIGADPSSGDVFVANVRSNNVSVISTAARRVVASVAVGSQPGYGPSALAVDPVNGLLYVADFNASSVSVIDPASPGLATSVVVGLFPIALAVDPVSGDVYVANEGSANVSVIDSVSPTVSGTVPLALYPLAVAIAPGSSARVAVVDYGAAQLSLFPPLAGTPRYAVSFAESGLPSGTSWSVTLANRTLSSTGPPIDFSEPNGTYAYEIADVPGWHQEAVPYTGTIAVRGSSVTEPTLRFQRTTYSVVFAQTGLAGGTPWSVALNGSAQSSTGTSITFVEPNGTYAYSIADVPGWHQTTLPYSGSVRADGASVSEPTLDFTRVTYPVTFTETGLPSGTNWSVALNGTSRSSTASSIGFPESNGTYAFATSSAGWQPSPASGSLTVSGAAVSEAITFRPSAVATYPVTFTETGLPSGTNWSVTVNGTTQSTVGSTIAFTEPNGTYAYSIADVPGWHQTTLPYSGTIAVHGSAVAEPTLAFARVVYTVTVTESGLPNGTLWWFNVTSGPSFALTFDTVSFLEPNGSYFYTVATADRTYHAVGASWTVDGSAVSLSVVFAQVTYPVTFTESGLPAGVEWWVNLTSGGSFASTAESMTFAEPNGSYFYTVATVDKSYEAAGGTFAVRGAEASASVAFARVTYPVTFTETGLPSGTSWSVTVNGTTQSTVGSTIRFVEPNGTYAYSIADVPGWHQTALPYSGTIAVHGSAVAEPTLAFRSVTYTVTFTETGLPPGTNWWVTVNGTTLSSTAGSIAFAEANGTYTFSVATAAHYTATPPSGALTVSGSPATEGITFGPSGAGRSSGGSLPPLLGLPGVTGYYVLGGVFAAVAVAVAGAVLARRWRKARGSS
ncbi:MAG: YncE family protein [Candidatus Thermoplasmatota archaeon]|nr:YncE family protein [Candidatus Thermoplasmatota archaeon]MCL5983060.1 YncE family protein [Candidatus Thermoplasmatota archaeon]